MATRSSKCLDNRDMILLLQMRQQLSALALEIKGISFSKGSVCAFIKKQHGITKRKKVDVYREFHTMIVSKEKLFDIPERALNKTEIETLALSA